MKGRTLRPKTSLTGVNTMHKRQELLTAEELAERLRVQPSTIRRWSRCGRIPQIGIGPKVIRYDYDAVLESLRTRSHEGTEGVNLD